MAQFNKHFDGHSSMYKKASWYKLLWCDFRHTKKYKIYTIWNLKMSQPDKDIKVYGCSKCDIWTRID